MECKEVEMSKEELQKWIRHVVNENDLVSPDVLKKCKLLQSILERREKHAERLLRLCQSVAACEAVVKKQYSLLGLDYNDDAVPDVDDNNIPHDGHSLPSSCGPVHSDTKFCWSPSTIGPTPKLQKLRDKENPNGNNGKIRTAILRRKLVVVLIRLPESEVSALLSSHPKKPCSELEPLISSEGDSSDLDFTGPNKKRKLEQKSKKPAKHGAAPQAKSSAAKAAPPRARTDSSAESHSAKAVTPEADRNSSTETDAGESSTSPKSTNGDKPAPPQPSNKTNKARPAVQQREVHVKMHVLARRKDMDWQRGQIMEILTKDDGRVKYKVNFEEKGKHLVSGHHIAFDFSPNVSQLFVGARVVIQCPTDRSKFWPGVLSELPTRKNRQRFLIFTDDHMSLYVCLPALHLVCRPLTDPLDDILDETHKSFIKHYLKTWPFPHQTQYQVGQHVNVECNRVLQNCEVQKVDCSIIQVVFQKDQHKEWIYRGSIRLEQMLNLKKQILQQ